MTLQNNLISNQVFDLELHEIYVRLGEVVLVPVGDDDKLLAQPKSFPETQAADYLRRLAGSNVGVMLGPSSGDLFAVLLRTTDAMATFMRDNPVATKTAVMDWAGKTLYFFRIDGFAPRTTQWTGGEWLGTGRCVPLRAKNQRLTPRIWKTNAVPARIVFNDLVWSDNVQSLFTPDIVEARYGRPFFPQRNGRQELNFVYWAYYFTCENDVRFSLETDEFYYFDTDVTAWKLLSSSVLDASILEFLVNQCRKTGFEPLRRGLNAGDRKKLIRELRVVALCQIPGLVDNVKEFVTECVEEHDGSNVTIAELYAANGQFCNARQVSKLGEREFQNKISAVIESLFDIRRSHSIERPNGNPRGFRNLRLKVSLFKADGMLGGSKEQSPTASAPQRQVR
jgi:hypothetical protein